MVFAAMSFQATYTCPSGPVVTVAPIERPGPFGSVIRTVLKVTPRSRGARQAHSALDDPPLAASQANIDAVAEGAAAVGRWCHRLVVEVIGTPLNSKKVASHCAAVRRGRHRHSPCPYALPLPLPKRRR